MKKFLTGFIIFILAAFVLYNSVYFEKLDLKKQQEMKKNFNSKEAVDFFWKNKLNEILKTALNLSTFDSLLTANPEYLIKQYGKSVGISSDYSFLVKGYAKTVSQGAEEIPVDLPNGNYKYKIVLKYIFGNAARDAVGYFKVDDFNNTMDFNEVATELNSVILKKVIDDKFVSISPGAVVKFIGAVEINSENIKKDLDVVPLKLEILK